MLMPEVKSASETAASISYIFSLPPLSFCTLCQSSITLLCTPTDWLAMAPCPFLDLPLELRERIYTYLLTQDQPICLQHIVTYPRLAKVNRQIRNESLDIFFRHNVFNINNLAGPLHSVQQLSHSLTFIGQRNITRLRYLRLTWHTHSDEHKMCLLCAQPTYVGRQMAWSPLDSCLFWSRHVLRQADTMTCNISVVASEPWLLCQIEGSNHKVCEMTVPDLQHTMERDIQQSLIGLLSDRPDGKKVLNHELLAKLTEVWQLHAGKLLSQNESTITGRQE